MKRLVKLLTLAAVIAAVAVLLKRRPAPPTASPTAPPTPAAPKASAGPQMPTMPKMPTVSPPEPEPEPETSAEDAPTDGAAPWVEPTADGSCPVGYPVKAKASSKIFHVRGGVLYDKTVPDRCYPSGEAAIADGYRQSLR